MKAGTQTDICIPMFIAELCIIAKRLKQAKCPSMDEWIHKMWYNHIYNGILFNLRRKQILIHTSI